MGEQSKQKGRKRHQNENNYSSKMKAIKQIHYRKEDYEESRYDNHVSQNSRKNRTQINYSKHKGVYHLIPVNNKNFLSKIDKPIPTINYRRFPGKGKNKNKT